MNITLDSRRVDVLYRSCSNCDAKCKSIAGMALHLRVCGEQNRSPPDDDSPKRRKKRGRAFSREPLDLEDCELHGSRRDDQADLDMTDAEPDISTFGAAVPPPVADAFVTWNEPPDTIVFDQAPESEAEDEGATRHTADIQVDACGTTVDQDRLAKEGIRRILNRKKSIAVAVEAKSFEDLTGRAAGSKYNPTDEDWYALYGDDMSQPMIREDIDSKDPAYWEPFHNKAEFDLTKWFIDHTISKGAIDDFFVNAPIDRDTIKFKNANDMFCCLDKVPYGIPDDNWETYEILGQDIYDGVSKMKYTFHCRNIMNVIRFLIGNPAFEDDLTYAPVRQLNGDGGRVYSGMHTADWWWETQDKLPTDATIIPLLLASDKTVLTQHHGDKSAWPVYLTIGNLSNKIRRTPSQPSLILLGFIPVTQSGEERTLRGDIYHAAMSIMLAREYYINFLFNGVFVF
jgi:hypothetical protein